MIAIRLDEGRVAEAPISTKPPGYDDAALVLHTSQTYLVYLLYACVYIVYTMKTTV